MIDQANSEMDSKKRNKIVQKIGSIIYDDQPYIFIAEIPGYMGAYHSRLKASKWFMKYDDAPAIYLMSGQ